MGMLAKDLRTKLDTGDVNVEDSPSPPKILHEHSKTVIALATTFFGLSVTFSEKILGAAPNDVQMYLLGVVWLSLVLSVVSATVIVVQLNAFLSGKGVGKSASVERAWSNAANASTLSYILLLLAAVVFGVLGGIQVWGGNRKLDAAGAIAATTSFISSIPFLKAEEWQVDELTWQIGQSRYAIGLRSERTTPNQACIFVDARTGKITRLLRAGPCESLTP